MSIKNKYAKLIDGVVSQVQFAPEEGFEEVGLDVYYGMKRGDDGEFYQPVDEYQIILNAKLALIAALESLSHDFGDGRVIQARQKDEPNMRTAISRMERTGEASTEWLMKDNTVHPVSISDLHAAIEAGEDQGAAAWAEYLAVIKS